MRWHLLVGRLLFGGVLLCAAARQLTHAGLSTALAAHGVPAAEWIALAASALLALGGASIVLGSYPQVGLRLSVLYLIPATALQHAFWTVSDAAARAAETTQFLANVGLIGAAIALLALPRPWPWSLDAWLARRGGTHWPRSHLPQLTAAGRWFDEALRGLKRAAAGLRPSARITRSDSPPAIVERRDRGHWDGPAGTIVHMRRAIRTPSGRVLFVQSVHGRFEC